MANPASLSAIADSFPYWIGWMCCDDSFESYVQLNSGLLSHDPDRYPVRSRIRIYEHGEVIAEHFSEEMGIREFQNIRLNELIQPRTLRDGYFELAVFSQNPAAMKAGLYGGSWGLVVSRDGKTNLNFPFLVSKGADPNMVDSSYLYYPGITADNHLLPRLLVVNHQGFENEYDVTLYDSGGENELKRSFFIPKKSLQNQMLTDVFPDLPGFFRHGPGLLIFHFKYKMNAYIQTVHPRTRIITGMDHLGLLFGRGLNGDNATAEDAASSLANRLQDPLICFCKTVSEGRIKTMLSKGMRLAEIQKTCGAGTVCLGCVHDLEALSGEKVARPLPAAVPTSTREARGLQREAGQLSLRIVKEARPRKPSPQALQDG